MPAAKPDDETRPEELDEMLSSMHARLTLLWEGGAKTRWLAPGSAATIGRSEECEIRIDVASVSRTHARVVGGDPVTIEDLGSSNGIRIRGVRIEPNRPAPI